MGKEPLDGASRPGLYMGPRATRSTLWVFKAPKSPEGDCGKDKKMKAGGLRSWRPSGSPCSQCEAAQERLSNADHVTPVAPRRARTSRVSLVLLLAASPTQFCQAQGCSLRVLKEMTQLGVVVMLYFKLLVFLTCMAHTRKKKCCKNKSRSGQKVNPCQISLPPET